MNDDYLREINALQYLHSLIAELELSEEERNQLTYIYTGNRKFIEPTPAIPWRRLTEENKAFILANYKTMTLKDFEMALDVGGSSVRTFLIKNGITDYKRCETIKGLDDKEQKYIFAHYKKMTINEMAEKLNRKYHTIANFMNNKGLQRKRERS